MLTGVVTAIPYAPATGVTSRFTAVADVYVSRTGEHRNFGSSPALRTTARPRLERSYCRTAQKYGIVLMDTTPVHALTIYQEDVKDNPPATGNPFAGGIGPPMPTGRRWPRFQWTSSASSPRSEHGRMARSEPATARTGLDGWPPAHRYPPAPAPRWRR